jgi:hypothetical protein
MGRRVSKRDAEHVVFVINYFLKYHTQLNSHPNVPQTFSFHNLDKQAEPYNDSVRVVFYLPLEHSLWAWGFGKRRLRGI